MSDEIKLALYDQGRYVFAVPPVTHAKWSRWDWVRWIDGCNGWRP